MRSRQTKSQAISTPRFELSGNFPAGRPRAFASYRSAIFMGHSVWGLSTEDRPADAGTLSINWRRPTKQAAGNRRTAGVNGFATCRLWRQPVAFGGERAAHLSRPPDGREKRFCPLLGLRPKGGAARHPCSIVLNMAAPHTCRAGMSADKPAAPFCLMPGSHLLFQA